MNDFLNRFDTPIPLTLGKKVERPVPFSDRPQACFGGLTPRQHAEKTKPVAWVHDSRVHETDQAHPAAKAAGLDGSPVRETLFYEMVGRALLAGPDLPTRSLQIPRDPGKTIKFRRWWPRVADGLVAGYDQQHGVSWAVRFNCDGTPVVEVKNTLGQLLADLGPGERYRVSMDFAIEHDNVPF